MKVSHVEEERRRYGEEDMGKDMHLRDRYGRDEKKEEEEERRRQHASVVVPPSIVGGDGDDDRKDRSGGRRTARVKAKHVALTSPLLLPSMSRDGAKDTQPADKEEDEISNYKFYQIPNPQPCFLSPFTMSVLLEATAAAMMVVV